MPYLEIKVRNFAEDDSNKRRTTSMEIVNLINSLRKVGWTCRITFDEAVWIQ